MSKVVVMDTSILCCWLKVPGKETCGPVGNQWNNERVEKEIQDEMQQKATFVLPLATIIETGNHIAQANRNRFETAQAFAEILRLTAENKTPWAAFTDQSTLWDVEGLKTLADEWPTLAAQGLAIGDSTIKNVANYYAAMGKTVEILTGDQLLRSYTPPKPTLIPRRRK
ncbi:hypothetical protein MKX47_15815 [Solibacillus sp. FSL R7-0668]|uniref:hypothetical protein n=1 Tax=Solibacillus sp. FSL R7-0668 TaxID=2921688 RepID=UPI0030FAF05D